jgi:thymidylate kinase
LRAGYIVLADRYAYTAYARDIVRGSSPTWVRKVYDFAIKPDATFYFRMGPNSNISLDLENGYSVRKAAVLSKA